MANDLMKRRALLGGAIGMASFAALPSLGAGRQHGVSSSRLQQRAEQRVQLPDASVAGLF